jgi:putative nucleotidyltransferase with HDIG domain
MKWGRDFIDREFVMSPNTDKENQRSLRDMVRTLVAVIEEKDEYTKGHSERVATLCVRFAGRLGLPKKEIERLYLAGMLHDVGMVYIPRNITQKRGKLSEDESVVISQHPLISEKILSKNGVFNGILSLIRHHHEAYDGSGYPDGLKGEEIPLETAILSLADRYDAMVSPRLQERSLSKAAALDEIRKGSGRLFDPRLVDVFLVFMNDHHEKPPDQPDHHEKRTVRDIVVGIAKRVKRGQIELPVLPEVVQELQQTMNQPDVSIDRVAQLMEKDAVLSVRLIAMANSPMYRGTEKIYSVKQAIPRMGVMETRTLVTTITQKSLYETKNETFRDLMEKLWRHSLACAYATREISGRLGFRDSERFFLMGLVHDIGKPPLIKILDETLSGNGSLDMDEIIECIQEVHNDLGENLLKRWGFPQDYNRVAARHEGIKFPPSTDKDTLIVNLANHLVHKLGFTISNDEDVDLSELESLKLLEMDEETLQEVGQVVQHAMEGTADLF